VPYRATARAAALINGTEAEARFSLKYLVATALVHGSVRFAAFEPQRLADPDTRALMRRIDFHERCQRMNVAQLIVR